MTRKTTLSFTDRHHAYIARKVEEGVFATASAAVAAAVERLIEDEHARDVALDAMAEGVRARLATPREAFVSADEAFAPARDTVADRRG